MTKIIISKGFWQKTKKHETLYREYCPNSKCNSRRLYYPNYVDDAYCPECKTDLVGRDLVEGYGKRIAYHLEV